MWSSLTSITILTELPLKVIFHTVHVNDDYILGIVLCYIQTSTLQNEILYSDVLGLCQLQDITLSY